MKKLLLSASALVLGMTFANTADADCNGIYLGVRGGIIDYNYSKSCVNTLEDLARKVDIKPMLTLMKDIVPEYHSETIR